MKKGKVIIGTLAGLAAGALAGILFAPKKGTLTRKQIIEKGDGYMDELKAKIKKTKKHAEEVVETEKEKFDETQNEAKNVSEILKKDIAADIGHFS